METTDANNSEMLAQFDAQLAKLLHQRDDLTAEISKLKRDINDNEEDYNSAKETSNRFIEDSEARQRRFDSMLSEFSSLRGVMSSLSRASDEKKSLVKEQDYEISEAISRMKNATLEKIEQRDEKKTQLNRIEAQIEDIKRKKSLLGVS